MLNSVFEIRVSLLPISNYLVHMNTKNIIKMLNSTKTNINFFKD